MYCTGLAVISVALALVIGAFLALKAWRLRMHSSVSCRGSSLAMSMVRTASMLDHVMVMGHALASLL